MKLKQLLGVVVGCAGLFSALPAAQARTSVDFGVYVSPGPYYGYRHHHRHDYYRGYGAYPVVPVYPYSYGYEAPVIVVPAPANPPVYVERDDRDDDRYREDAGRPGPANYWYRCDKPKGYYPYVRECRSGWHTEVPSAPADR